MKAVVVDRFGPPEVMHLAEREAPVPAAGEVRVRVRAAGVNPLDSMIRSGAAQEMMPVQLPVVLGLEVAGTVDAVGDGVDDVAVGDDVLGHARGGYAELVITDTWARKPEALSWAAAAALPVATETAQRVLTELGVTAGETLLVHGAAGSVGTIVVQLAAARGAVVLGTAGKANQDHLRDLGAAPLLYGEGLVQRVRAAAPGGVDAVLDAAGHGALPDSVELRGGTSRIVTIADPAAFELGVAFSGTETRDAGRLAEAAQQAAEGHLRVTVSRTFALEEAAAAHAAIDSRHGRGKTVLLIG